MNYTENLNRNTAQEFPINTKVRVTRDGVNASDFNVGLIPIMGVYSLSEWQDCIFTVGGYYHPVSFSHNLKIYGAYPLIYDSRIVGHVYNTGLESLF